MLHMQMVVKCSQPTANLTDGGQIYLTLLAQLCDLQSSIIRGVKV